VLSDDSLTPAERASLLLSRLKKPETEQPETPVFDDDLIPDVEESTYTPTEADLALDAFVERIGIEEAYARFCGKMEPKIGNRRESVMISCPDPSHPDKNPSAWMNLDQNVWFCGGCQVGGDVYDIAACHFGMDVPGYKNDGSFPALKEAIAEAFGFQTVTGITGETYVVEPEPEAPGVSIEQVVEVARVEPLATVHELPLPEVVGSEELPASADELTKLYIDWEGILPGDTFLDHWMKNCTISDLPHEYFFWLGLQALAFAGDRKILLHDDPPVVPNLFLCLYGATGLGKSRSLYPYDELIAGALPHGPSPVDFQERPHGVWRIPSPGSAEALVDSFRWDLLNDENQVIDQVSMTGLLHIEEFASFISKASRQGSTLKETLIEFYDAKRTISIRSRTSGITQAKDPFCQAITTTQPKAIHAFLSKTDTESGFLNRWIFVAGQPRRKLNAYGGEKIDVSGPTDDLRTIAKWADAGHDYRLEGAALRLWESFFYDVIEDIRLGKTDNDSMLARVDLILKKLIVLMSVNLKLPQPTEESVQMAISLFDYLKTTFTMLGRDISFNSNYECQEALRDACTYYQQRGVVPTRRDIVRRIGRKFDLSLVDITLRTMVSLEIIVEEKAKKTGAGRPTTRYKLND
jgi:hypothetical protein